MTENKNLYEEIEINSADIIVPTNYQREFREKHAALIAKDFDERLANMPKVSSRDGNYYVFDGQHTIAARKQLNGGKNLPILCRVYHGLTEEEEALLFAQQFGVADDLAAGAKMRALIFGKDKEALAFEAATKSAGLELNYAQIPEDGQIACICTAFNAFKRFGKEAYVEALRIIVDAWGGEAGSLRYENIRSMTEFVALYKGEYNRARLVKKLRDVDSGAIYRKGQAMAGAMTGYKKYLYQILIIYNGTSKKTALPLKF